IPNSLTLIGDGAFHNCTGFNGTLTLGDSLETIGYSAFSASDHGSLLEMYFTGNLIIPNSVTSIGADAFAGCSGFTGSLTIPNSVTTIGNSVFWGCSGFTGSLTIPNSVTAIGEFAFSGCSGFTGSLTIPNSVTTIGRAAFQGCHFTGSLVIPNSITRIEEWTFNLCWNFTSVIIPETVTFIGERAFACWYGLQSMTVLANTPHTLDNNAFANVSKTIPVYVPTGTIAAYQAAPGWSEFTNYHEIESSYTITTSANPAEGGSVTGGGSYTQGTTCTLTATANEGYSFVNWTENNEVVSTNANYSFTVSENRNLVANFALSGTITNHWTPESANYSEIMAMYSVIQIDGVEQYSNTLEVGVFCGDECRGSAIASEFYLTHRYLAILDVFGENGHQLTFKLYDHSIEQELNLTSPATVTFDVNGYGNPVEPYVLNFTSSITHSQALNNGWNWWSTYVEQNGIDGLDMLENSIGSAGVRIQGRNGTIDQFEYQGSSYWYGSLTSIENEQMYKIRTNAACNAVMVGYAALPANHPITINGGWNWIGFPCSQSVSVNDAMSGFTPVANDVIKGRNGSTTYVSYGSTSLWYGTLNTLEPG
ncbi:MAG: leucine-rich repeat domain-containing protein, partial [Bacteroidales bacterium]|nr:leucine-rich repeat domain-containing protein [Bacteroidales bacterium]